MGLPDFAYHRPATLAEACNLGRTYGNQARFLAGGTEVLVDLRQKRFVPEHVIALGSVPDLNHIRASSDLLRIGAMVRLEEIAESADVSRFFPALCEAVVHIGSVQIRSRATIGGNFCGAVPCADTPPVCIAGGATLRLVAVDGERTLPAREFFRAPRQSALEPDELLAEILLPRQPESSGISYQRFSLRSGSALAVASVAARITLEGPNIAAATVVLGAVAPVPLPALECARLLEGQRPSVELFNSAAERAAAEAKPISDVRGSEAFRRELVQVLTSRALREATARAGGGVQ
jgi:carbon-monoxide dehydrogenase medium subunit